MKFNNDAKFSLFLFSSIGGIAIISFWLYRNKGKTKHENEQYNPKLNKNLTLTDNKVEKNDSDVKNKVSESKNSPTEHYINKPANNPENFKPKPKHSPDLKLQIPQRKRNSRHKASTSIEKSDTKDQTTVEDREFEYKVQNGQDHNSYYHKNSYSSSEFSDSWELSSLEEEDEDLRTQFISPLLKEESAKGKKYIWDFLKTQTDPIFSELQVQFERTLERNFSLAESTFIPSEKSDNNLETEIRESERRVKTLGKNHQIRKFFTNRLAKNRSPPSYGKTESLKSYLKGKCPDIKLKKKKQGRQIH